MVIELTKKTTQKQIANFLKKIKIGKNFDAKKYYCALKWDIDGLNYRKELRNEWD